MIAPTQLFASLLRDHGYSLTRTRQQVFDHVSNDGPLTIKQLVLACPDIDRASVYRSVSLFESLGIIRRIYTGWKYQLELSDGFGRHHHHATCSNCERIIPLEEDAALEQTLSRLAERHHFSLKGHEIELTGYCDKCVSSQK